MALSPIIYHAVVVLTFMYGIQGTKLSDALNSLHLDDLQSTSESLSFVSCTQPDCGSSYLNFRMKQLVPKKFIYKKKSGSRGSVQKPASSSKIKSSGYGTISKSTMFHSPTTKTVSSSKPNKRSSRNFSKLSDYYEGLCSQKPKLMTELMLVGSGNLLMTKLSADGQYALCASNEGMIDMLKIGDQRMKIVKSVSCHRNAINDVNWSHSGELWLTCSEKSAKVWCVSMRNQEYELELASVSRNKHAHIGFEDEVAQVQFYYIDQFILLASKNILHLYGYRICSSSSNMQTSSNAVQSQSKLVVEVPLNYQAITAIAAPNQFYSNLVVCAGTDKSLDVVDMNVAKVSWHADAVSNKAPYTICLNEGCANREQESYMYNLFLTASLGDGVKLWDLRSKQSVMSYSEHSCRTIKCNIDISSCGQYFATGTEDNSIFIYDLRSMSSIYKLTSATSAVTSVCFSPSGSQLLSSSLEGRTFLYGPSTYAETA